MRDREPLGARPNPAARLHPVVLQDRPANVPEVGDRIVFEQSPQATERALQVHAEAVRNVSDKPKIVRAPPHPDGG